MYEGEPATWIAATLAAVVVLWRERRRLMALIRRMRRK